MERRVAALRGAENDAVMREKIRSDDAGRFRIGIKKHGGVPVSTGVIEGMVSEPWTLAT